MPERGPEPHQPPTGTVTFLFTDIEGSTRRWEAHPDAMRSALARHDAILREAIEQEGGYIFKTMGDAFCVAFTSPHRALAAALSSQLTLHDELWPEQIGSLLVRMALHTGAVDVQNGDYFGQPLNRVARLLSAGYGGQTLLSDPTYSLVRDNLPAGVSLLDLGEHHLKDLFRSEHVFQLVSTTIPSEFPSLKSLDAHPNNLPLQPTPLIGREHEVAAVAAIVQRPDVRLLTLTGPGGIGKTRLALQAAADLVEHFHDGAYFVNLAPISDHSLVISTIAQTLGVKETSGGTLDEMLKSYLQDKQMLLVLDNFEQVVKAAPQIGMGESGLLAACPDVKVLATSRVPLSVRGEHEHLVPPLSMPDQKHLPPLERLTQYEAVRLFIERAQAIKADFAVTNENAPAVAEICHRLDGLPLAIELAAARVRLLTPQSMLSRLQNSLKLLTGGAQDLPARQQTLRAAIEWSYDLLSAEEQKLFRRLAVFVGGCTLEAIEEACNAQGDLEIDVLDGVDSLISSSLLNQQEGAGGEPRFVMLETMHEFACEKLQESGEKRELKKEHAHYFMHVAEEAAKKIESSEQVLGVRRVDDDLGNIRAALDWSASAGDRGQECRGQERGVDSIEVGLRILVGLAMYWELQLSVREPLKYLVSLIEAAEERQWGLLRTTCGASALRLRGRLHQISLELAEARAAYQRALSIARELGDKRNIALALNGLGHLARHEHRPAEARAYFEEVRTLWEELGDMVGVAKVTVNLGGVADLEHNYELSETYFRKAIAINREMGHELEFAFSLSPLSISLCEQGRLQEAEALCREELAIGESASSKWVMEDALVGLGDIALTEGKYDSAQEFYERALQLRPDDDPRQSWNLLYLAYVAVHKGDLGRARSLLERGLSVARKGSSYMFRAFAMCFLPCMAAIHAKQGYPDSAVKLLAATKYVDEARFETFGPYDLFEYNLVLDATRQSLKQGEWERAWEEGRAMSMDEAIEYALQGHEPR